MTALLGGEVELFTDQIGVKHGFITEEQGGRSYYHQDSYYWKIEPELGINCWIPLDEVGPDAIALAVRPGGQPRGFVARSGSGCCARKTRCMANEKHLPAERRCDRLVNFFLWPQLR